MWQQIVRDATLNAKHTVRQQIFRDVTFKSSESGLSDETKWDKRFKSQVSITTDIKNNSREFGLL